MRSAGVFENPRGSNPTSPAIAPVKAAGRAKKGKAVDFSGSSGTTGISSMGAASSDIRMAVGRALVEMGANAEAPVMAERMSARERFMFEDVVCLGE
jgi:hypothetical protein